jgi:hypothetical protein
MRSETTIALVTGLLLLSFASLSGSGKEDVEKIFKNLCQGEVRILKETR